MKRYLFIFSFYLGNVLASNQDDSISAWSKTMAEVFHTVKRECYFPVETEKAMIKALDAFTQQADAHSRFLGPAEYKELLKTTSGEFYGVGVELGPKQDGDATLTILSVKPGGPAHKEGVQKYDKIIAIDGTPVSSLTIEECVNTLKGNKRYSPVKLDIIRDKKALSFTLTRDAIPEESCWCCYFPQQRIVYCAITLFTQQLIQQLEHALTKGIAKNPKGIIIDLRDNAGGVLQAAVDCAGLFLARQSIVVSTKGRNNRIINQYHTNRKPLVKLDVPIIILVNNETASSAEILAQSLKIHSQQGRKVTSAHIFIAGTPTFGKGSIQEIKPLSNNCALKITTGLYYLPDDTSIQEKGIQPDIEIKQKYPPSAEIRLLEKVHGKEQRMRDNEKKRDKDKEQLTKKRVRKPSYDAQSRRLHLLKKDYQVHCACTMINVLDLGKRTAPREVATHEKALAWLNEHFACPKKMDAQIV